MKMFTFKTKKIMAKQIEINELLNDLIKQNLALTAKVAAIEALYLSLYSNGNEPKMIEGKKIFEHAVKHSLSTIQNHDEFFLKYRPDGNDIQLVPMA